MDHSITDKDGKIYWVDVCKGIGILFVVLGHIAGGYAGAGIFPEYTRVLVTGANFAYVFHMTLLFILSGYLFYRSYAVEGGEQPGNVHYARKLMNFAWIFILHSIAWWAIKQVFADSVNIRLTVKDLAWFLIRPIDPYWYLWVLFFYYLIFYYIGKRGFRNKWVWAAVIAASLAGSVFWLHWEAFRRLLLYMFPFYLGMYLSKQDSVKKLEKWVWILCGMISMAAFSFIIYTGKDVNAMRVIGIVSGVSISLFIILLAAHIPFLENSRILRWCGRYSLEIYVFHNYITAANRVILFRLGITGFYINIAVNFLMAVIIPICVGIILRKTGLYPFFFNPGALYKRDMG